jgi:hypothetical protein
MAWTDLLYRNSLTVLDNEFFRQQVSVASQSFRNMLDTTPPQLFLDNHGTNL